MPKDLKPAPSSRPSSFEDDYKYWKLRAVRTERMAKRQRDPAIRSHYMKIAAGYDKLASRALQNDAR